MLADERHLHVLAGRGHQLPALWRGGRSLLLIPAHADQEEKARDDEGNRNARDQDIQNPHPAAVLGTCEQQGFVSILKTPPLQLKVLQQPPPSSKGKSSAPVDKQVSCSKGQNCTSNQKG